MSISKVTVCVIDGIRAPLHEHAKRRGLTLKTLDSRIKTRRDDDLEHLLRPKSTLPPRARCDTDNKVATARRRKEFQRALNRYLSSPAGRLTTAKTLGAYQPTQEKSNGTRR